MTRTWMKPRYSNSQGTCLEVSPPEDWAGWEPTGEFRKPWASNPSGNSVEVAQLASGMWGVRDSKDPASPVLQFDQAEMDAFILSAQAGQYGQPQSAYPGGEDPQQDAPAP